MRTRSTITCNNTCKGVLSTLQARDVFCGDRVCIVQPRGDKGSSDSMDRWRVKQITNMFKSTDMVETGFGYSFCMFRERVMRGSSTTPSILTWFESRIVTPEMFTETWLDNKWARWLVAKRMALNLSAFSVILLAQNQACSDSKQDSRAETCVTRLFGDKAT